MHNKLRSDWDPSSSRYSLVLSTRSHPSGMMQERTLESPLPCSKSAWHLTRFPEVFLIHQSISQAQMTACLRTRRPESMQGESTK
ncbi:MAG: hypothetical protein EBU26_11025 [Verrucomicrobia bacterium]|nr:hypothetical protein [Verrucomicrobiota bacterium]